MYLRLYHRLLLDMVRIIVMFTFIGLTIDVREKLINYVQG